MAQSYGNADEISVEMEGPYGSIQATDKNGTVAMAKDAWKGGESPYSQEVAVKGISVKSIVDLQPDVDQIAMLCSRGIALVAENDGGRVTVHAIGGKPDEDITMQITIREVTAV